MIVFGLGVLVSLGVGGWAFSAGSTIEEQLKQIDTLSNQFNQYAGNPVNKQVIEQTAEQVEVRNASLTRLVDSALAMQMYNPLHQVARGEQVSREPLIAGVLPEPESNATAHRFKGAYKAAMKELREVLNAGTPPSPEAIAEEESRLRSMQSGGDDDFGPWGPPKEDDQAKQEADKKMTRAEILRGYPPARAAESKAREMWMYLDEFAFEPHQLVQTQGFPEAVHIWQAQMSLWIQQDIAAAILQVNQERAEALRANDRADDIWVAHMPIKRLERVSIDDKLGRGGGSNLGAGAVFAESFTGIKNNQTMFVVPIQLEMILEEASLNRVLESLCSVGFYTPVAIKTKKIEVDPIPEDYVYGAGPLVRAVIDLEGYYFRKVFDPYIPEDLKVILQTPGAKEPLR